MGEPVRLLWVWRHPRPEGAVGRCIGRTDVPVDPRRAKRLAHRIRQEARRQGLPRHVLTSPLQRCAAVGRWLKRWGWRHEQVAQLSEMDFGCWDGLAWEQVPREEIDAWCAAFEQHRPGGGENLRELLQRAKAWRPPFAPIAVVSHGGWMLARRWAASGAPAPGHPAQWPAAPRYGECWHLDAMASGRPLTIAGAAA